MSSLSEENNTPHPGPRGARRVICHCRGPPQAENPAWQDSVLWPIRLMRPMGLFFFPSRNNLFQVKFHNIKVHNEQECCREYPGGWACETYAQVAVLSGGDDGDNASADQLGDAGHHRQQAVAETLDAVTVNVYDGQRDEECADAF